jgi:hypothetical protein
MPDLEQEAQPHLAVRSIECDITSRESLLASADVARLSRKVVEIQVRSLSAREHSRQ